MARRASSTIDGAELIGRFSERKEVAVIAGFQGVHPQTGRITTLGRGGSDTSRGGDRGRHQGRPLRHLYRRRRRLHHRSARGAEGAPARQGRVRGNAGTGLARRQGPAGALGRTRPWCTMCRSSCARTSTSPRIDPHQPPGTLICDEEDIVEQQVVTGIAFSKDEAQITLRQVAGQAGRRRGDFRTARRRQYQCRHDRPERFGRRRDYRSDLHRSGGRFRARPRRSSTRRQGPDRLLGSTAPPTWPKSR